MAQLKRPTSTMVDGVVIPSHLVGLTRVAVQYEIQRMRQMRRDGDYILFPNQHLAALDFIIGNLMAIETLLADGVTK